MFFDKEVTKTTEKPPCWVYTEDNGWININDFLSNINMLRQNIKQEKKNVEIKFSDQPTQANIIYNANQKHNKIF